MLPIVPYRILNYNAHSNKISSKLEYFCHIWVEDSPTLHSNLHRRGQKRLWAMNYIQISSPIPIDEMSKDYSSFTAIFIPSGLALTFQWEKTCWLHSVTLHRCRISYKESIFPHGGPVPSARPQEELVHKTHHSKNAEKIFGSLHRFIKYQTPRAIFYRYKNQISPKIECCCHNCPIF